MRMHDWDPRIDPAKQLVGLSGTARDPGFFVVRFREAAAGPPVPWPNLERWTSCRAVSVADVGCDLPVPALEVALCCDLVYLRSGARLCVPEAQEAPTAGVVWALGRAGVVALRRGLLDGGPLAADEAVALGLATAEVGDESDLPLPEPHSVGALTAARDLLRSRSRHGSGSPLELATFRMLFATGDPEEGARAFLEGRTAVFD